MSIRPKYGKRSVLQVLSDGMSQHPPTGKSCCEDAALNAAEVDRLTRERDEAQEGIAAQKRNLLGRIEEVETERDEWKDRAEMADEDRTDVLRENDKLRAKLKAAETKLGASTVHELVNQRDELQDKLDAAEQHPTLDREAVKKIVVRESHGNMTDRMDDALTDAIMALAPAVPSWLGDIPDKPKVKRVHSGEWQAGRGLYKGSVTSRECRSEAWELLALADAIDAEEAKRNAEDEQRIEEQAKALFRTFHPLSNWEENVHTHGRFRAAVRDGWTKEDQ